MPVGVVSSRRLAAIGRLVDAADDRQLKHDVEEYWTSLSTHQDEKVREDSAAVDQLLVAADELAELAGPLEGAATPVFADDEERGQQEGVAAYYPVDASSSLAEAVTTMGCLFEVKTVSF